MVNTLRNKLIRLAHEKPELRPHLLPILKTAGSPLEEFQTRTAAGAQKRLRTRAETVWEKSGHEEVYDVYLVEDPRYYEEWGLSLRIKGTPGSWFISSLLSGKLSNKVWIDHGQRWAWTNPQEVFREVDQLVTKQTRYVFR